MRTAHDIETDLRTIARKMGAQKFDVFGTMRTATQVKVERGKPGLISASDSYSFTLRVWNSRGQMGVATTTDISAVGLGRAMQLASEASALSRVEDVPDFSPGASRERTTGEELSPAPATPVGEILERMIAAEKQLLDLHPAVVAVPYNMLVHAHTHRIYVNSAETSLSETLSGVYCYMSPKAQEEGRRARSSSALRLARDLAALDFSACADEAGQKILSHLAYRKIPSGVYPVVFSPRAFLALLQGFENFVNARSILDRNSLLTADRLNQMLASPLLTIIDNATHATNLLGNITFDQEGTSTTANSLIDEGRLVGLLHTAQTAREFRTKPTGNAIIGAKVMAEPNYWVVQRGAAPKQETTLLSQEKVIYIDELKALHAGISSRQGSFSLPFDGWIVEKGQRTSIEAATVAGDFLRLLEQISFVGADAEVTPSGVCPEIWVEGLSITGE